MIEADARAVPLLGDPLGDIYWQGKQWAVTSDGIECRDGTYFIAAGRLRETWQDGLPGWPRHMAEKNWVDLDDFMEAFLAALKLYPEQNRFTQDQLLEAKRLAGKLRDLA